MPDNRGMDGQAGNGQTNGKTGGLFRAGVLHGDGGLSLSYAVPFPGCPCSWFCS